MKKIDPAFNLLAAAIATVSALIAYFVGSLISSGVHFSEIFGSDLNAAQTIALGVGAGMGVLQFALVLGGIGVAYINEIYK